MSAPSSSGERIVNPDGTVTIRMTNLRRLILATGEPQYVTAGRSGISPYILSLYVQGKKDPSARHLKKLAEVLNCQPRDILGWQTFTLDVSEDEENSSDRLT